MWELDSSYFVRFASRLPYYSGAVHSKIKTDYQDHLDENGNAVIKDSAVEKTVKMKLSDAISQTVSDDFSALNHESQMSGMGDLFERVSVPGN